VLIATDLKLPAKRHTDKSKAMVKCRILKKKLQLATVRVATILGKKNKKHFKDFQVPFPDQLPQYFIMPS